LNITGNTVTHASDSLVINDPLILLANNNPGNLLDTGFIAHYIEGGTTKHTGLVRDSSANTYYLFDGYTPHIQETNILDPNDASLRITTLRSNLISDSVLVRGYDVVNHTNTAFSQANTATTNAATADQKSVSAGVYANAAFSRANTATTNAATADQRAVTSGVYANSAFATANSKTSNVGTVTSVGGTGSYGGLTLTGTVTTSGSLTLGGTPTGTWPITAANITGQTNSATITAGTGVNANQIVLRDGNGYIYANHINFNTSETENPSISSFITSNGDGWSRKSSKAHVVSQLQVVSNLGSSYYQVNTWLQLNGAYGLYAPTVNGAHFYPNTSSSYGEWAAQGSRNGYSGIQSTFSGVNGSMYDGSGNGGAYREANGRWFTYYNVANDCIGIGTSSTSSGYSLYAGKGFRSFSTNYTDGVTYSTTYYDTNDPSYYVDPAVTSRMNSIITVGTITAQGSNIISGQQGGVQRGYLWNDSAGFGFLNSSGSWALRVNQGTNTVHVESILSVPSTVGSGTFPMSISSVDRGIIFGNSSGSGIPCYFTVSGGATVSGSIIASGGSTSYNTSSDYRMKENDIDINKDAALDKIIALRPITYDWKQEFGGRKGIGFIAHELDLVAPECVSGEKDAVNEDGTINPQSVDTSWLIPSICAAMQKQQELIEQLMAKVAVLEGK
jgi:hypothetical protein